MHKWAGLVYFSFTKYSAQAMKYLPSSYQLRPISPPPLTCARAKMNPLSIRDKRLPLRVESCMLPARQNRSNRTEHIVGEMCTPLASFHVEVNGGGGSGEGGFLQQLSSSASAYEQQYLGLCGVSHRHNQHFRVGPVFIPDLNKEMVATKLIQRQKLWRAAEE
ncbi:MAG: hypothetical protein FRX49_06654 [Trebouxia sp. A1-2]|nr:MAG: hypothetical protein FRX49_06654 [Trebouxia sp. A1-2]